MEEEKCLEQSKPWMAIPLPLMYSDIGLVSAEGGKDIINLTNSGYMSGRGVG